MAICFAVDGLGIDTFRIADSHSVDVIWDAIGVSLIDGEQSETRCKFSKVNSIKANEPFEEKSDSTKKSLQNCFVFVVKKVQRATRSDVVDATN